MTTKVSYVYLLNAQSAVSFLIGSHEPERKEEKFYFLQRIRLYLFESPAGMFLITSCFS